MCTRRNTYNPAVSHGMDILISRYHDITSSKLGIREGLLPRLACPFHDFLVRLLCHDKFPISITLYEYALTLGTEDCSLAKVS